MLDRFAFFHAQVLHDAPHPVRGKYPHQVIFKGQIDSGIARVTLAPGTAAQLVVDAATLMPFRTDDVETPGIEYLLMAFIPVGLDLLDLCIGSVVQLCNFCLPVAAEDDVRPTACHIGSNSDGSRSTRLGNDLGFLGVKLGI